MSEEVHKYLLNWPENFPASQVQNTPSLVANPDPHRHMIQEKYSSTSATHHCSCTVALLYILYSAPLPAPLTSYIAIPTLMPTFKKVLYMEARSYCRVPILYSPSSNFSSILNLQYPRIMTEGKRPQCNWCYNVRCVVGTWYVICYTLTHLAGNRNNL